MPNYADIPRDEICACVFIGQRLALLLEQHRINVKPGDYVELDGMQIAHDIALCHLFRKLNLRAMQYADPLLLISEYEIIARHINRACETFPIDVKLAFAACAH